MSEKLLPCPYVIAGPWTDDDGQTFIEIQRVGGHELIAQIYADKAEAARLMAEQAITAWNTRAAMQADAAPVAWMYERGSERKAYVERSQAALACGYAETPLYAHPPVADRVSTSSPLDDRAAPETSGKLRDAMEVWGEIKYQTYWRTHYNEGPDEAAVAIIEQDREAVRAEQAAEVADYLKEGETIAECIARNRADANVLLEMFAAERVKVENYAKTMKIISDIANREAAELAKFKALAETLAGALEAIRSEAQREEGSWLHLKRCIAAQSAEALREYKEARDAS